MPTEIRHILFRPPEIVSALIEYSRRMRTPLPSGSVLRAGVRTHADTGEVAFTLVIANDASAAPGASRAVAEAVRRDVTVKGSALAAALILFCRDRRIPLPSDSDKSLRQFGEQLALVVTRNPKKEEMPRIEPG